jgi:hypothetical protein
LIEDIVSVALNRKRWIAQESEVLHLRRVFKVDQDRDAFAAFRFKDSGEQPRQAEGREVAGGGVHNFSD